MSDVTKGLSRLAYQFKNSTKLQAFLEAFLQQWEELRLSDLDLLNERYLDTAVGVQLDGIGEIVGISRLSYILDQPGAFGFLTDPTADGFGDSLDPLLGGHFVSFHRDTALIDDDLYRIVIRAKIIKNHTAMTVDDTTRLVAFMFSAECRYFLVENLKPIYAIGKLLTASEATLLDQIPILLGLGGVSYFITYDPDAFSFSEDPTGLGFGDSIDPLLGGHFAKII